MIQPGAQRLSRSYSLRNLEKLTLHLLFAMQHKCTGVQLKTNGQLNTETNNKQITRHTHTHKQAYLYPSPLYVHLSILIDTSTDSPFPASPEELKTAIHSETRSVVA